MPKPILLKNILREMLADGKFWKRIAKEAVDSIDSEGRPLDNGGQMHNPLTGHPENVPKVTQKPDGTYARTINGQPVSTLGPRPIVRRQSESLIGETTDLRSLVAKGTNEAHANEIVKVLQSYQIDARAADGAVFNPSSQTEDEGWGIYVTAGNVINAGKVLGKHQIAQGASFDPYVKSGK